MQITLTNLGTVTPDEAEETLQTVTDFLKGLNLEKLITLLLLLAGCLVVMKLVLRLTDRAFLRLEPAYLHPCGPAGYFVDDYPVYRSGLRGSAHD
jgi:hypothetical protein